MFLKKRPENQKRSNPRKNRLSPDPKTGVTAKPATTDKVAISYLINLITESTFRFVMFSSLPESAAA